MKQDNRDVVCGARSARLSVENNEWPARIGARAVAREGDVVKTDFRQPNVFDRTVNRAFGVFLKLGIGLRHNYLLEVHGRKTGRVHSTPVNLIEFKDRKYLVAPRGYTQWVRNVEASGEATLVRGARRERVRLQAVSDEMKPEVLKAYLDRFKLTVQRYFPIRAGSPPETFRPLSANYPVFELSRPDGAKP